MKNITYKIGWVGIVLTVVSFYTANAESIMKKNIPIVDMPVIPAVKTQNVGDYAEFNIKDAEIHSPPQFKQAAEILADDLKQMFNLSLPVEDGKGRGKGIVFLKDNACKSEGYILKIDQGVTISASSYAGAFYGVQTLIQLLATSKDGKLNKMVIKDFPEYRVRSMLLDVGRKFVPVDGLKDWIRMLGRLKMNELHLHLNDNSRGGYSGYRLESKIFPGLPSKDGYYTFKEIREIQNFAKKYGVSIVPEIDSPGHSLSFTKLRPDLAQKEMDCAGLGLAYLDLDNPETYTFIEKLFDEVVPLFDSSYFHIGTDEYRLGLIKNQKERQRYGELFRKYINRMNAYLREKHNKTVRIWSGYEHMPGKTEPDTSIVIDMWETSDAVNKSKAGYQFVNSTHLYTYIVPGMPYYGVNNAFIYNEWTPLIFNKRQKKTGILPADAPGLLGGKLHVWNDGGPTGYTWNEIARLAWPSMQVFAEKLWGTKGSPDYREFCKRAENLKLLPEIPLLNRKVKADKDGVVWQMSGDKYFIANTSQRLIRKGAPENLEYPWSASFTITRQSDTIGNDTLISSDLAAFYIDLEHETKDKKTKKMKNVRGVACVRAQQAPGYEPLLSFAPLVIVFNYKVPFNKKVRLTFVGKKDQTSLYVDGKLIETVKKQMVCPLKTLGTDKTPESFQGILYKAVIKNEIIDKK